MQLDSEPSRVKEAISQAAVDAAESNLAGTQANVRGLVAKARSQRFKLQHAIEDVDNQVATLRQPVATWEQSKATLAFLMPWMKRSVAAKGAHVSTE